MSCSVGSRRVALMSMQRQWNDDFGFDNGRRARVDEQIGMERLNP